MPLFSNRLEFQLLCVGPDTDNGVIPAIITNHRRVGNWVDEDGDPVLAFDILLEDGRTGSLEPHASGDHRLGMVWWSNDPDGGRTRQGMVRWRFADDRASGRPRSCDVVEAVA